ncbi:MAG: hypothetical protein GX076_10210, partial [Clostridiales bacterium]|nr:hypothetical protein [Clostridiales bacterium]
GLDMKPRKEKAKKPQKKPSNSTFSAKDKARLMLLTVFIGLLCICLIVTAAYSAQVKYNINGIIAECEEVRGDIQNLNAAIMSATNIKVIEEEAINQLGMIYPTIEQIKYISSGDKTQDLALTLKQIAYNQ